MNRSKKPNPAALLVLASSLALTLPGYALPAHAQGAPASSPSADAQPSASPAGGAPAQSAARGPVDAKETEAFVDGFFARDDIRASAPGAEVVIVKDGRILLNKGYGYADLENKKPVDVQETLFRTGSVSKVLTATALLQLVEAGKVSLKDDFTKYLPGLELNNPFPKPVTVEHLLTHTTGFDHADPLPGDFHYDYKLDVPIEEYVKAHLPTVVREPGTTYSYDNFASMLQGLIVEKVSGMPFEDYMQKHVFGPLGMKNSTFASGEDVRARTAVSYDLATGAAVPYGATKPTVMPQGSLSSTSEDMARFLIAQLNGGEYEGRRILKPETVRLMQETHFATHPKLPNMGYGFEFAFHGHFNGEKVIGKGGDIPHFASWMWLMPERGIGVYIVNNSQANVREAFFNAFMDHYFPAGAAQPASKPDRTEAEGIAGYYRDLRIGDWVTQIRVNADGDLEARDRYTGAHVLKRKEPFLYVDEQGSLAGFQAGPDGAGGAFVYLNTSAQSLRIPAAQPYTDVPENSPYYEYADFMNQVLYRNEGGAFEGETTVTRAAFARDLARLFGVPASETPVRFADMLGRPEAAEIEALAAFGITDGKGADATFRPDDPIAREEAAVMIYRAYRTTNPAPELGAALAGQTDDWAQEAVRFLVQEGIYGPATKPAADGRVDFRSLEPLSRQESAALLYKFYFLH